jgi:UDP-glucuronate decarboxylase
MHILFTGGTGFFGKAFLRYWSQIFTKSEPIFNLTILSRNTLLFKKNYPEYTNLSWVHFKNADILEPITLKGNNEYTHIIHAAADSTNGYSVDPMYRFEQITFGTKNILEFAINSNIEKILLTSSGAVYGKQPNSITYISENYNGAPDSLKQNSTYGLSKKIAENICCLYSEKYGIKTIVARCFAFGGPDLPINTHYALGNFINDVKNNNEITINGDGKTIRSYLHQNDLSEWIFQLLIKGDDRQAYNVGSKHGLTILELAEKIKLISKVDKKIIILNSNMNQTNDIYLPNITKIESEIGVTEKYNIEKIITEML